jgi:hypothetical protein
MPIRRYHSDTRSHTRTAHLYFVFFLLPLGSMDVLMIDGNISHAKHTFSRFKRSQDAHLRNRGERIFFHITVHH